MSDAAPEGAEYDIDDRVVVELGGAPDGPIRRAGVVTEARNRVDPEITEYVVELDRGGSAYVDAGPILGRIPELEAVGDDSVVVHREVLEELVDVARGKVEGDVSSFGPDGTGYDVDAFVEETIEPAEAALESDST